MYVCMYAYVLHCSIFNIVYMYVCVCVCVCVCMCVLVLLAGDDHSSLPYLLSASWVPRSCPVSTAFMVVLLGKAESGHGHIS